MIKHCLSLFITLSIASGVSAQNIHIKQKKDTAKQLEPVIIRGYLSDQPLLSVPASVSVISKAQLSLQPDNSFVSALNSVPGVRAEERSPGSYRLSIRGSLLRSPFGIRDVKIYYDEIPLTDAGGNTYLNAIDINSINHIEILKGPDGSLFGANSGGVVLLSPVNLHTDSNSVLLGLNGGSYGLVHENVAIQNQIGNSRLSLNQGYESYGGYRQHSYMQRHFIQAVNRWTYNGKDELRALAFYSDLNYQTPGGLTLAQYQADPQSARLPTKFVPGAIAQKIGITTKMLLGGVVNELHINNRLRNVLSVFGSYVDFSNPFITNYEQRYESTYGLRTYFELSSEKHTDYGWKLNLGLEWQQTKADINNYGNRKGVRDTAQTLDKINTNQHFFFTRYVFDLYKRWHAEAALSLNFYDYKFRNVYPNAEADFTNRHFTPQLMPRVALSYDVTDNFIWRASVSRGYSTPTTAEIRPTNNIINTNLQAQYGWNYETGFRLRNADQSMFLDASVFYYVLHNAIVLRLNPDETEYYINAGGTHQPGIELYFSDWIISQNGSGFIRGLQFNESLTLNKFTFSGDYHNATANYPDNKLTGVPGQVIVSSFQIKFPDRFYLFIEHNYTGRIPLTDANTVFASHYNLLQTKAGWQFTVNRKSKFEIYAGAGNLLNEKYSLGNDLNAVGNRFYNPAPLRNYFIGFNAGF
ncbi:TonB-dependent receptor [Mucilaginibacter sp. OK098]|uniref:TonB-dependent receptor n=1 Tax=Mucilaginibacter sp. OK098 TaxID=1855297 RepID=UPI00091597FE|nr:TonB-dependent receptor [Mucilaginibacter sp. OK098]SHN25277.1 iron complex outermembrane recepter protein [Mucilaginibacter sp. OK098]